MIEYIISLFQVPTGAESFQLIPFIITGLCIGLSITSIIMFKLQTERAHYFQLFLQKDAFKGTPKTLEELFEKPEQQTDFIKRFPKLRHFIDITDDSVPEIEREIDKKNVSRETFSKSKFNIKDEMRDRAEREAKAPPTKSSVVYSIIFTILGWFLVLNVLSPVLQFITK